MRDLSPDAPLAVLPIPELRAVLAARAPRHLPGAALAPLRWEDVDFLVSTLDLSSVDPRRPPLRLVRGASELPLSELIGPDGRGDLAGVRSSWHRGYTIVLNSVHRRLPALWALARGLSGGLGRALTINLYLTPAGEQGFEAHTDTHDALFLQAMGGKRWTLRPPDGPEQQVDLQACDLLYVPRGCLHAGRAGPAPSAHWSVALLEEAAPAEDGPGWDEAPALDLDTPLIRPAGQPWRLLRAGEHLVVDRLSASLHLPAAVEPALRAILEGGAFTLRDLPGEIDEATRSRLGALLLREGWLRRGDGPSPPRRRPG